MQCQHGMSTHLGVEIQMPSDFVVIENSKCTIGLQANNYTCIADRQKGTIKAIGFLTSAIPANTDFQFTIDSIRNPARGSKELQVGFSTIYEELGAVIDTGLYTIPNDYITGGNIVEFTVNPMDYGVGQYPVFYDFVI